MAKLLIVPALSLIVVEIREQRGQLHDIINFLKRDKYISFVWSLPRNRKSHSYPLATLQFFKGDELIKSLMELSKIPSPILYLVLTGIFYLHFLASNQGVSSHSLVKPLIFFRNKELSWLNTDIKLLYIFFSHTWVSFLFCVVLHDLKDIHFGWELMQ